jgi:Tfp pilus assembly protein PilN
MIEINLLPGTEKRKKQRPKLALKLPGGSPAVDRITAFMAVAWIIGPLVLAWMFFGVRSERSGLQSAIDQAAADSVRYARLIETQASLQARQDTISQKLTIIQDIDAGRYIWPHILDEISRALPPYTWIESIQNQAEGRQVGFTLTGGRATWPRSHASWTRWRHRRSCGASSWSAVSRRSSVGRRPGWSMTSS